MREERLSSPNTVGASQSSPKFLIRDMPADIMAKLETESLKVATNATKTSPPRRQVTCKKLAAAQTNKMQNKLSWESHARGHIWAIMWQCILIADIFYFYMYTMFIL